MNLKYFSTEESSNVTLSDGNTIGCREFLVDRRKHRCKMGYLAATIQK